MFVTSGFFVQVNQPLDIIPFGCFVDQCDQETDNQMTGCDIQCLRFEGFKTQRSEKIRGRCCLEIPDQKRHPKPLEMAVTVPLVAEKNRIGQTGPPSKEGGPVCYANMD